MCMLSDDIIVNYFKGKFLGQSDLSNKRSMSGYGLFCAPNLGTSSFVEKLSSFQRFNLYHNDPSNLNPLKCEHPVTKDTVMLCKTKPL